MLSEKFVPVVELDTIKASDAFGSGSSPDGHTKQKSPLRAFFVWSFSMGENTPAENAYQKQESITGCRFAPSLCDGTSALREVAPTDTPFENKSEQNCSDLFNISQ